MIVKIKKWEDLEKEFGLDEDGDISNGGYVFTKFLNSILPKNRIIEINDENRYVLKDRHFNISNNVLEDLKIEKISFSSKQTTLKALNNFVLKLKDLNENTEISFSDEYVYILSSS